MTSTSRPPWAVVYERAADGCKIYKPGPYTESEARKVAAALVDSGAAISAACFEEPPFYGFGSPSTHLGGGVWNDHH